MSVVCSAYAPGPQVSVSDAHNDLLMLVTRRPPADRGRYFRTRLLPQLRAGGVSLQVLPVFVDDDFRPELALRQLLRMTEAAHRIAEENCDAVTICATGARIEDAQAADRIALVLALESCAAIGEDVELLRLVRRLGVRIASFTHMGRTALADGSGEDASGGRLTSLGVEALALMEDEGILLDVSHLSRAGVGHVLEIARRPVLATHSSARAVMDHHRNLSDEQVRGIVGTGGIVCVNFYPDFVAAAEPTVDHLIDHVAHLVEVAGIDNVGLGPDFIHEYYAELSPAERLVMLGTESVPEMIPGLEGPSGLPMFVTALRRRGFGGDDIAKIAGTNLRRFLLAYLPADGALADAV